MPLVSIPGSGTVAWSVSSPSSPLVYGLPQSPTQGHAFDLLPVQCLSPPERALHRHNGSSMRFSRVLEKPDDFPGLESTAVEQGELELIARAGGGPQSSMPKFSQGLADESASRRIGVADMRNGAVSICSSSISSPGRRFRRPLKIRGKSYSPG